MNIFNKVFSAFFRVLVRFIGAKQERWKRSSLEMGSGVFA